MASQALSPETPPKSGECCLFKIPPEIRIVIYQMAFEGLWSDVVEGLKVELENLTGNKGITGDNDSDEDSDGDRWDPFSGEDEHEASVGEDENSNEHEQDNATGEEEQERGDAEPKGLSEDHDITGESRDVIDQNNQPSGVDGDISGGQSEASSQQEHEQNVATPNDGQVLSGDDGENTQPQASDSNNTDGLLKHLRLARPPLLRSCQQIRKEAIPVYSNALIMMAEKTAKEAMQFMVSRNEEIIRMKESSNMLAVFLGQVKKFRLRLMVDPSVRRLNSILTEVALVEKSVGGSVSRKKEATGQLEETIVEFARLSDELLGVGMNTALLPSNKTQSKAKTISTLADGFKVPHKMSDQAESPSAECHLFGLPPELRAVIYDMVFEDVDFDGDDEDVSDSDWEDIEEEDDAEADTITEGVDGLQSIDIESEEETQEDYDDAPDYSSELTRPPLLDTCKLIRREAAPLWNYRLTLMAIEILENTAQYLMTEKRMKDVIKDDLWLGRVELPMDEPRGMSERTRKCMDAMNESVESMGMTLGDGPVQRDKVRLREAQEAFEEAYSKLFGP
ncbi:hypothetical protein PRZ48_012576 [Zasmidium cellare]|uniref:Uncharacterized protein n=1 Tax=Zasmidium cellare TaxID=395010 RepID=A0ABR0E5T6_ZASCE|nr:hypothetical protein PRZ48_012576 [Zasmidium cellare]